MKQQLSLFSILFFPFIIAAQGYQAPNTNQLNSERMQQQMQTQQIMGQMQQQVQLDKIMALKNRIISDVDKLEIEEKNQQKLEAEVNDIQGRLKTVNDDLVLLNDPAKSIDVTIQNKIKDEQKQANKIQNKLDKAKEKLADSNQKIILLKAKIEAGRKELKEKDSH